MASADPESEDDVERIAREKSEEGARLSRGVLLLIGIAIAFAAVAYAVTALF